MRKTKIIATLGPASNSPEKIEELIKRGVDCFRLNFSHIRQDDYSKTAEIITTIRSLSRKYNRQVGILQDFGGVKLRIGELEYPVTLGVGDKVRITSDARIAGRQESEPYTLPFPHPDILASLEPGSRVYISDGIVCLVVEDSAGGVVNTYVRNQGHVSSYKGVNLPGISIDRSILTEKDRRDAVFGAQYGVDWVGLSFIQTGQDARDARSFLMSIGSRAKIMAKIELGVAVKNIAEIVPEVDGIMVARGDLGIELDMETVPRIQKELVRKANEQGVVSVVATQMLLSMVNSPRPTRAETSDISTAVLDGCDAILLSDEIAVGNFPEEAVSVADRTMVDTETVYPYHESIVGPGSTTRSVAKAATLLAAHLNARCIVVTSTGKAAIETSRFRHDRDVLVFSHQQEVLSQLALVWGLRPVCVVGTVPNSSDFTDLLVNTALHNDIIRSDDTVVIVSGFSPGTSGTTNSIQVLEMKEYLARNGRNAFDKGREVRDPQNIAG